MTDPPTEAPTPPPPATPWWRRWILSPILTLLKQGTSPSRLAWTIATGVTIGLFPVPGTRGWLCLATGLQFRLNQPLLHTFKGLFFPLHLALIIPFIRMGEWLFKSDPLPLNSAGLDQMMAAGTWNFLRESAGMLMKAATAWALTAPFLLLTTYSLTAPLLSRWTIRIQRHSRAPDSPHLANEHYKAANGKKPPPHRTD